MVPDTVPLERRDREAARMLLEHLLDGRSVRLEVREFSTLSTFRGYSHDGRVTVVQEDRA